MHSMTGYGRGVASHGDARATVDARSVNHRFLDLKLRGGMAPSVEEAVANQVRSKVARGSVTIQIHVERARSSKLQIDPAAAEVAHAALSDLALRLRIDPPDLALVLAQPGVVVAATPADDDDDTRTAVLAALDHALAQLGDMRGREGAALAADLTSRLGELDGIRAHIATLAGTVPSQLSARLSQRVKRLIDELATDSLDVTSVDPARLAQEVALYADRADITEELVRLSSHLDQARGLLAQDKPVGRRLDFLVQEIGRELNTIGSKSTLADITAAVVDAKAGLEKVREQVQNVE